VVQHDNLTAEESALLKAICLGLPSAPVLRLAWSARLALEQAGHDPATIDGLVCEGWLALWPLADGCRVTLTPLAAFHLGVEIDEEGPDEHPVWVPATPGGSSKPIRLRKEPGHQELLDIHPAPAPEPDPDEDVLRDEWTGNPVLLFGQLIKMVVKKRQTNKASQSQNKKNHATRTT
jgi:hypothetical protein